MSKVVSKKNLKDPTTILGLAIAVTPILTLFGAPVEAAATVAAVLTGVLGVLTKGVNSDPEIKADK